MLEGRGANRCLLGAMRATCLDWASVWPFSITWVCQACSPFVSHSARQAPESLTPKFDLRQMTLRGPRRYIYYHNEPWHTMKSKQKEKENVESSTELQR